ncbi:DNA cytosine methyltransferase [Parasphingorhabdus sp.]|uniref:DNA cytosine methyltransferase n=1 Tax=Parasphingorhabdus sp. TaxID=2709688 RepID=UPI003298AB33
MPELPSTDLSYAQALAAWSSGSTRISTVCYVEREAFAARTLVARMEDKALDPAPLWDDFTTFDGKPWCSKVHLVSGGYPCQHFSFAGKRKGEDDPRHLWPHIKRIVKEVDPE